MKRIFHSRGFRLSFGAPQDLNEKIYYKANWSMIKNFLDDIPQDILTAFEYSVRASNGEEILESVNFHVDLLKDIAPLYREIPESSLKILRDLPKIFDENFRNYTVGLRINNSKIIGRSFYFYSTIWKGARFGMNGVTEKKSLEGYLPRFADYFKVTDSPSKIILEKYFGAIRKLKGVSVSVCGDADDDLKIYARTDSVALNELFLLLKNLSLIADEKFHRELEEKFGAVVLTALRIKNDDVTGINLYFLK